MHHVVEGRQRGLMGKRRHGHQQRAHGADNGKADERHQTARAQHADSADGNRDDGGREQPGARHIIGAHGAGAKDRGVHAQDRIGADLGHDGKEGGHRGRGVGIGRRQPELHRKERGFDRKDNHQKDRGDAHKGGLFVGDLRHLGGQIGDVERAGGGVKRAKGKEKERGASEVHHHVLQPGAHPVLAAGMDHQPVRGDEQHFEKHEEVKDVAGEERAADAHELKLEQRMEMPPAIIPAGGNGVDQHDHRQHCGQQHHERREPVEHQHDAKGCGPVSQPVDKGLAARGHEGQAQGNAQKQERAGDRGCARQRDVPAHDKADEGRHHGGQDDGQDDPVHYASASSSSRSSLAGSSGSISILSLPASRKAPRPIITSTAVIPKEITMAVSTSAWGRGSV